VRAQNIVCMLDGADDEDVPTHEREDTAGRWSALPRSLQHPKRPIPRAVALVRYFPLTRGNARLRSDYRGRGQMMQRLLLIAVVSATALLVPSAAQPLIS
jgi:hypothetical protein